MTSEDRHILILFILGVCCTVYIVCMLIERVCY